MNSSTSYCYVPDEKEVFSVAQIISKTVNEKETILLVQDVNSKRQFSVKEATTVAVGSLEELQNPPSDLIKLIHVHRPGILHTLKSRFQKDEIYTSIGPILVAVNPFKWIKGVYDEAVMSKFKSKESNLSDNPHVFAVADEAYSDLYLGQNQSLIIRSVWVFLPYVLL